MTRVEQLKQQLATMKNEKFSATKVPLLVRAEESVRMFGVNYSVARAEMLIRVEKAKQA